MGLSKRRWPGGYCALGSYPALVIYATLGDVIMPAPADLL